MGQMFFPGEEPLKKSGNRGCILTIVVIVLFAFVLIVANCDGCCDDEYVDEEVIEEAPVEEIVEEYPMEDEEEVVEADYVSAKIRNVDTYENDEEIGVCVEFDTYNFEGEHLVMYVCFKNEYGYLLYDNNDEVIAFKTSDIINVSRGNFVWCIGVPYSRFVIPSDAQSLGVYFDVFIRDEEGITLDEETDNCYGILDYDI